MSIGKWLLKTFEDTDVDKQQALLKETVEQNHALSKKLEELSELYNRLCVENKANIDSLKQKNTEIKDLETEKSELNANIVHLSNNLEKVEGKLKDKSQEYRIVLSQLDECNQSIDVLTKEKSFLSSTVQKKSLEVSDLERKVKAEQLEVEKVTEKLEVANATISRKENSIAELCLQVENNKAQIEQKEKIILGLEVKKSELEREYKKIIEKNDSLSKEITRSMNQMNGVIEQNLVLSKKQEELKESYKRLCAENEACQDSLNQKNTEIKKLEIEKSTLNINIQHLTNDLKDIEVKFNDKSQECQRILSQLNECDQSIEALSKEKSNLSSTVQKKLQEVNDLERKIKAEQLKVEEVTAELEAANVTISRKENSVVELSRLVDEEKEQNVQKEEMISVMETKNAELERGYKKITEEKEPLSLKISSCISQIEKLTDEKNVLLGKQKAILKEKEILNETLIGKSVALQKANQQIESVQKDLEKLNEIHSGSLLEIEELKGDVESKNTDMQAAQNQLASLQAVIQTNEEHIHSLEEQLQGKKDKEMQQEMMQKHIEELHDEIEVKDKDIARYNTYLDKNSERISSMEKEQLEQVSIIAQLKRMLSLRRDELNKMTDNE